MTEAERKRTYYRPRILISVDDVLESTFTDSLVCLTGAELNILRNLVQYAEREANWVSEYHTHYYLTPTDEEWQTLQALVAELEQKLMGCDDIEQLLQDILTAAQCACNNGTAGLTYVPPRADDYEPDYFTYDDTIPSEAMSAEETEACAVAQLWYQWGYEIITEKVLPATRWGWDYIVPAVAGFVALALGGPGAALGVYSLAELIQNLLDIGYTASETNFINWLESNKQDIVCSLYFGILDGGTTASIWSTTKADVVTPAEGISDGDKLIISLFMGSWAGVNAQAAYDAATDWATDNVTAGYCDECERPPQEGTDWIAYPVDYQSVEFCTSLGNEYINFVIDKIEELSCRGVIWVNLQAIPGQILTTWAGSSPRLWSGSGHFSILEPAVGSVQASLWDGFIDADECKAAIAPTAAEHFSGFASDGAGSSSINLPFRNNGDDPAKVQVTWVVYEKPT